jgi:hypothetical protein
VDMWKVEAVEMPHGLAEANAPVLRSIARNLTAIERAFGRGVPRYLGDYADVYDELMAAASARVPGSPRPPAGQPAVPPVRRERRLAGNHPGRNRSGGLDQTDRLPRPHDLATCEIATFRYRVLHVAARITRGTRKVRLRIGRDLAVGHRDLPSMATTSGRAPLTTRPTRAYRPKATRPGKPAHRATPADPSHPPATINTQTGSSPTRHHPRQQRE